MGYLAHYWTKDSFVIVVTDGANITLMFLLFLLFFYFSSSALISCFKLMWQTARCAKMHGRFNMQLSTAVWLLPQRHNWWYTLSRSQEAVIPYIKTCHGYSVGYSFSSITPRAATYSVHLQFFPPKVTFKAFLFGIAQTTQGQCPCCYD